MKAIEIVLPASVHSEIDRFRTVFAGTAIFAYRLTGAGNII
jgi:hypothetical protein